MPEPLAPALEQLARLLEEASERVRLVDMRLDAHADREIAACLQRAGDRIAQARAMLGPAPAKVAPGSLEQVATASVRIARQQMGRSTVTLLGAPRARAQPISERQRIAVAALIVAALSNSQRHRPDMPCEVSIAAEPVPQVVIVSGQPLDDAPRPHHWAALTDSDLGPLAGAGLTLSAALAHQAGLELRALHGAQRTALALQVDGRSPVGMAPSGAAGTLQQRVIGTRAALSEHGALSLLADVMPLVLSAQRRELARAVSALRDADALAAEAAAYGPMQPAR